MRQTLEEIAQRLNLSIETLDRWIRQGRIPVSKTGEMGVFHEVELNKWAAKQEKNNGRLRRPARGGVSCPGVYSGVGHGKWRCPSWDYRYGQGHGAAGGGWSGSRAFPGTAGGTFLPNSLQGNS